MLAKKNKIMLASVQTFIASYCCCLIPIVGLMIVYYGHHVAQDTFEPALKLGNLSPATAAMQIASYGEAVNWYNLFIAHCAVCFASIPVSCVILYSALSEIRKAERILALLVIALVSVWIYTWKHHYYFPINIFKATLVGRKFGPYLNLTFDITDFQRVDKIAFAASFFIVVAGGSTLIKAPSKMRRQEQKIKFLTRQMFLLRACLYAGMVVLVSTILVWRENYQWALVYVSDQELHKSIASATANYIIGRGIYYSTFLAVTYLPSALLLRIRAQELLDTEKPEAIFVDRERWLDDHGLTKPFKEVIPRIIAILGPLLSGTLPEILKALSGH